MHKTIKPGFHEVMITSALRRGVETLLTRKRWGYETERQVHLNDIVLGEVLSTPKATEELLEINCLELVSMSAQGPVLHESLFKEGLFLGVAGNRYAPPYIVGGLANPLTGASNPALKGGELATGLFSLGPIGHCNHCCIEPAGPTVRLLGVLTGHDRMSMSLRGFKEQIAGTAGPQASAASLVVVAGHSSNAGKTTCAQAIVAGLTGMEKRVGYVKMSGTASCRDLKRVHTGGSWGWQPDEEPYRLWSSKAGIRDFVDGLGVVSDVSIATPDFVAQSVSYLEAYAAAQRLDIVVVELADGLCHASNLALFEDRSFCSRIAATVYSPIPSSEAILFFHSFWSHHANCKHVPLVLSGPFANEAGYAMVREEVAAQLEVPIQPSARRDGERWRADGSGLMESLVPLLEAAARN